MAKNLARSIYSSQEKPVEAIVKGTIPKWISGTLFRNGPGRFKFGDKSYQHFFDGMAVINKFQVKNGKVFYTNKILETNALKKTLESNKLYPMFGTRDPCTKLFDRFKMLFDSKERAENDNVNVNVVPFGNNQLYALTEAACIVRVDPNSLNVMNKAILTNYIKPTISSIAHPHIDDDGSWISAGMHPKGKNISYDFMKFDASKNVNNACENLKMIAQVPSSHKLGLSYFHSFAITKNYIVFLEQSLVFDIKAMFWSVLANKPFSSALKMKPDFPTRIRLVNKRTGEVLTNKFYTDPQFTFHHINAYETAENDPAKNEIIVDICSYSAKNFDIESFVYDENDENQVHQFLENSKAYPKRVRVPLYDQKSKTQDVYCKIEDLNSKIYMELPTINYHKNNGRFYNYAYGIGSTKSPYSIVKINVNKYNEYLKANIVTDNRLMAPSEPIFVAHPEAKSEDDGVVLTVALGDKYDTLFILDAKTLEEIGRAELPESVKATFTFHGFFADNHLYKNLN